MGRIVANFCACGLIVVFCVGRIHPKILLLNRRIYNIGYVKLAPRQRTHLRDVAACGQSFKFVALFSLIRMQLGKFVVKLSRKLLQAVIDKQAN